MQFDLVTPQKQLAGLQAEYVEIPGAEGDFGVMEGHQPTLSSVRAGIISVKSHEGTVRYCVSSGFADVGKHNVTILAEDAVNLADVQKADVNASLKDAEAALKTANGAEAATAEKRVAFLTAQLHALNANIAD